MTEALLAIGVILSALAVALCVIIIFRSGRSSSGIPSILDQRLLSIEGAIGRSDATIRDEFGRDREEARQGARSLREEVSGLFERLAGSLRASVIDLSTGQQAQLETFATRSMKPEPALLQMLTTCEKKSNRYYSSWEGLSATG